MFISKVFKLQFRLQSPLPSEAGTLSSTEKKSNWEERIQPRAQTIPLHKLFCGTLIGAQKTIYIYLIH